MAGLLARMFGRRTAGQEVEERRDASWSLGAAYGFALSRGTGPVPVEQAENLSAVLACLELITGALSSLPVSLVVDSEGGQQPAPSTASAWRLLERPNGFQSWPKFVEWTGGQILTQGNAVLALSRDGRGAISGLAPVCWHWLNPMIVAGAAGPRLVYDVLKGIPQARLLGLPERLLDSDVMHVRARSDDGVLGRSVLSRAPGVLREAIEISTLAESNWRSGARPSGVLSIDKWLNPDQRKRFETETSHRLVGMWNAGAVPLMEGGMKFDAMSLSSVDAEFLSSRAFSVAEIARLFRVPEVLIQQGQRSTVDPTPYIQIFAQQCLLPLVTAIEHEFDHSVLPSGMHLQLDLSGLLRGNFSSVAAALCATTQSGITTANDARTAMGWPPVEDGDALRVSGAPSWPADAHGMPHLGPSPGPTGDDPPAPGTHANSGRNNGKSNGAAN